MLWFWIVIGIGIGALITYLVFMYLFYKWWSESH